MRKCICAINEGTIQDYISEVERVLKLFDGIDFTKLKKAVDDSATEIDNSFIRGYYGYKVSSHQRGNSIRGLAEKVQRCVKSLEMALEVLKGNKTYKIVWELPHEGSYDWSEEPYTKGINPPKKWVDYVELIKKAMNAVNEYKKLLYNSNGGTSDLQREIAQIIRSGGLYQETLKDLKEICIAALPVDYRNALTVKDGSGNLLRVTFPVTYGLNVKGIKTKIEKYISSNKDKYPEIELRDVFRSGDNSDIICSFRVALEKVPKTDIQPDPNAVNALKAQPTGQYDNIKIPSRDIQKMTEYFNKGSNPKTLANTVKDVDKAVSRYYIAVSTGWKDCEDAFYERCKELGVSEGDLKVIHDKAVSDKSIDIGDTSSIPTRKTISAVSGTSASSSSITSKEKKTISADTGFILTGDNSTPFS